MTPRPVTPLGILVHRLRELADRQAEALPELQSLVTLAEGIDSYAQACTSPESPALRELAEATAAHDWTGLRVEQEMLSGHVEGQFLKTLVHATRARRVLEIGMFTGYSALAMAEALPEDGRLIACELDPDVADFARKHLAASGLADRITIEVGPAARTLAAADHPFDLVFLDADKPAYQVYVNTVLDRGLLADHGLIVVDNTLLQGEPWVTNTRSVNGAAIAAFNESLTADPRVEQVLIPLRDGVTLIRRSERR
jgi:caffeoyl-CoA O-methyltransferase